MLSNLKTCTKCKIEKSLYEFDKLSKAKDGLSYQCKSCKKEYAEKIKASQPVHVPDYKICLTCKKEKPKKDFGVDRKNKDHLAVHCKLCNNNRVKKYTKNIETYFPIKGTKICSNCKEELKLNSFWKNKECVGGVTSKCKRCASEYNKEIRKKVNNKPLLDADIKCKKCSIIKKGKEYSKNKQLKNGLSTVCKDCSRVSKLKSNRKYNKKNKKKLQESNRKHLEDNRESINKRRREYQKIRRKSDPLFRITGDIRNLIGMCFRNNSKSKSTEEILGCSFSTFKVYLSDKFEDWMTWENRGLYNGELNYGWDLDHIIPISSAETEEEIYKLNHYTNFQPLCSKVNRDIKVNKLDY